MGSYFDGYEYDFEYAGESSEEYGQTCSDWNPSAPRCWSGPSCPFLAKGTCQYFHPAEDMDAEDGETKQQGAAFGASSRPWNVLVNETVVSAAAEMPSVET